ncbi:MAG: pilus assembly protein [Bacillota bacterium]|nr:pilus assembly protein [Bacillota bacterium]
MSCPQAVSGKRSVGTSPSGQALIELILVLPLLIATALGGLTLCRLAVGQTEVRLAAILAAAERDPASTARAHLERNRVVRAGQAVVNVRHAAQLRLITVTCPLSPGWWPGKVKSQLYLTAVAGRGRTLLCTRPRR